MLARALWIAGVVAITGMLIGPILLAARIGYTAEVSACTWEPASGPVATYVACLVWEDGESECHAVPGERAELIGFDLRAGLRFHCEARAYPAPGSGIPLGPWSVPSLSHAAGCIPEDIDCDGAVGGRDRIALDRRYGDTVWTVEDPSP